MSQPALPAVECAFVRPGCAHTAEPLFTTEYKRTNRTRATKIVRCFPHCCPSHRPRSYCGTSLYVQVRPSAGVQLVVYGRFELVQGVGEQGQELDPKTFQIGDAVQATEILGTPQAGSIWVKGERENEVHDDNDGATVYCLQGSSDEFHHWESDWRSGTSQQQRLTPHHFRVYVFAVGAQDPSQWHVVGIVTSPPFTFVVYRKHQHDPAVVQQRQALEDQKEDYDSDDSGDRELELRPEALRDLVWHRQHRSAATNTTHIAILTLLAHESDPRWLAAQSRSLFALLQAAVVDKVPDHLLLHYVNHCVPQLVSLLPRHLPTSPSSAKNQVLMETLAELVCFILDPAGTKPVLAFVGAHACLPVLTEEKRRELMLQWIDMVAEQVEDFFQQHGRSTEAFVDDVVSIVMRERSSTTRRIVKDILRNTRVMGQDHFDALLAKLHDELESEQPPEAPSEGESTWTGRWLCRGFGREALAEKAERRGSWPLLARRPRLDSSSTTGNVGMMATIAIILSSVGFDLDLCNNALRVNPLATVLDKPKIAFPLDHVFRDAANMLPLEWATLLAVGGHRKQVFARARALDTDEQLELEFLAADPDPNSPSTSRCSVRLEIPSSHTASGLVASSRRRLVVHVRVEEAQATEPQSVQQGRGGGESDGDHSDSGDSTESEHPPRPSIATTTTTDNALRLYARVRRWHARFAFQCTYYAME